eukprot:scaffold614_cov125-Isochrysis_galbana.AAC.2
MTEVVARLGWCDDSDDSSCLGDWAPNQGGDVSAQSRIPRQQVTPASSEGPPDPYGGETTGRDLRPSVRAALEETYRLTRKEVEQGLMRGPFYSTHEVDADLGVAPGSWRALHRFAINPPRHAGGRVRQMEVLRQRANLGHQ